LKQPEGFLFRQGAVFQFLNPDIGFVQLVLELNRHVALELGERPQALDSLQSFQDEHPWAVVADPGLNLKAFWMDALFKP
jgi:hypothetical protein